MESLNTAALTLLRTCGDDAGPEVEEYRLMVDVCLSRCRLPASGDLLQAQTAAVAGMPTVIRVEGEGLSIKWMPKSKSGYRILEVPGWAVTMLRTRSANGTVEGFDPVFPAVAGGLRDPSNTQADLREIFARAGYGWVTSHVSGKTVATL